jgi:hypothetical protein
MADDIESINPHYGEHAADLSQDDRFTLVGMTVTGPGIGKHMRKRMDKLIVDIKRKHGQRAFEMPKRAAAIHEAGHVVVNTVLGIKMTRSFIEELQHNGQPIWIGYTDGDLRLSGTPGNPASLDVALMKARATYAGIAAENLFAGDDHRHGSSLDEVLMSQVLIELHAGDDIETGRFWQNEVAAWCTCQLHHNRAVHAQATKALLDRRRIKGKRLRELCDKVVELKEADL